MPGATKYWLVVRRTKDGSPRISKDVGDVLSSEEYGFGNDSTQYKWTIGVGDDPDYDSAAWWIFTNGVYTPPKEPEKQQVQQQQPDPGVGDIIGKLIRGAQGKPQQAQQDPGVGDIIGTLIRGAQGKPQQPAQQDPGVGDIIGKLIRGAQQQQPKRQQAKADAGINLDTIVNAVVSNSAMGGSYRAQSGSVVANSLITAVGNMLNKK